MQGQVEAALNEVVSEPQEAEKEGVQQGREQPVIPRPSTDATPASEFTTPYFTQWLSPACSHMEKMIFISIV